MHDAYDRSPEHAEWSRTVYHPAEYVHHYDHRDEYRHRREYDVRTSPERYNRNSAERRSYDRNTNSSTRKKMNNGYYRNMSPEWSRSYTSNYPTTDRNTIERDYRYEKYEYKQDENRRRRKYDFSTATEAQENRNISERPSYDRNTNSSRKRHRPGDIKYQKVSENEERRKDSKDKHRNKHESRHNSSGSSVDAGDRKKRKHNDVDRLERQNSSTLVTVQISKNETGTKEDPEKENHCDKVSVYNVDKENPCKVTIANNVDKDNSDEVSANVETESGCVEVEVASINNIDKENSCDKVSIQVNNVDEENHSEILNRGSGSENVAIDTDKNNEVSLDMIKEKNCNETSYTVDKENSSKKRKYSTSLESKDKTKNKKSKRGESVTDHINGDIISSILGKKTVSERTVAPSTIHTEKIKSSKPSEQSEVFFKKNNQRVSFYSRKENVIDSSPSCAKKISSRVNNKQEKVDNTLKSQKKYSVPSDKINNSSQSNSIGARTQNGKSEKLKATVKQNVSSRKSAIPIGRKKTTKLMNSPSGRPIKILSPPPKHTTHHKEAMSEKKTTELPIGGIRTNVFETLDTSNKPETNSRERQSSNFPLQNVCKENDTDSSKGVRQFETFSSCQRDSGEKSTDKFPQNVIIETVHPEISIPNMPEVDNKVRCDKLKQRRKSGNDLISLSKTDRTTTNGKSNMSQSSEAMSGGTPVNINTQKNVNQITKASHSNLPQLATTFRPLFRNSRSRSLSGPNTGLNQSNRNTNDSSPFPKDGFDGNSSTSEKGACPVNMEDAADKHIQQSLRSCERNVQNRYETNVEPYSRDRNVAGEHIVSGFEICEHPKSDENKHAMAGQNPEIEAVEKLNNTQKEIVNTDKIGNIETNCNGNSNPENIDIGQEDSITTPEFDYDDDEDDITLIDLGIAYTPAPPTPMTPTSSCESPIPQLSNQPNHVSHVTLLQPHVKEHEENTILVGNVERDEPVVVVTHKSREQSNVPVNEQSVNEENVNDNIVECVKDVITEKIDNLTVNNETKTNDHPVLSGDQDISNTDVRSFQTTQELLTFCDDKVCLTTPKQHESTTIQMPNEDQIDSIKPKPNEISTAKKQTSKKKFAERLQKTRELLNESSSEQPTIIKHVKKKRRKIAKSVISSDEEEVDFPDPHLTPKKQTNEAPKEMTKNSNIYKSVTMEEAFRKVKTNIKIPDAYKSPPSKLAPVCDGPSAAHIEMDAEEQQNDADDAVTETGVLENNNSGLDDELNEGNYQNHESKQTCLEKQNNSIEIPVTYTDTDTPDTIADPVTTISTFTNAVTNITSIPVKNIETARKIGNGNTTTSEISVTYTDTDTPGTITDTNTNPVTSISTFTSTVIDIDAVTKITSIPVKNIETAGKIDNGNTTTSIPVTTPMSTAPLVTSVSTTSGPDTQSQCGPREFVPVQNPLYENISPAPSPVIQIQRTMVDLLPYDQVLRNLASCQQLSSSRAASGLNTIGEILQQPNNITGTGNVSVEKALQNIEMPGMFQVQSSGSSAMEIHSESSNSQKKDKSLSVIDEKDAMKSLYRERVSVTFKDTPQTTKEHAEASVNNNSEQAKSKNGNKSALPISTAVTLDSLPSPPPSALVPAPSSSHDDAPVTATCHCPDDFSKQDLLKALRKKYGILTLRDSLGNLLLANKLKFEACRSMNEELKQFEGSSEVDRLKKENQKLHDRIMLLEQRSSRLEERKHGDG